MACVLVTGASGVIGSQLVPLLLDLPGCQLRLILRASSENHVRTRLADLAAYWQLDPRNPAVADRLQVFVGDVCHPRLGLQADVHRCLSREVTHIVHCAGNVRLNQSLKEARADALGASRRVVELAEACQHYRSFVKLDVVSTIGVAGRKPGLVPEQPLREPRRFHNPYEQAKAEAEDFLFEKLAGGLPLTVHRPSMVVGHSTTGRILHFQVFYYLCDFLSGRKTGGVVVDTADAMLDIIPVDYVARAIALASQDPNTAGRVFHLCSGPKRAVRLADLRDQVRDFAARNSQELPPLRLLSPTRHRKWLAEATRMSSGGAQKALRALGYLLEYLDEVQTFDVTQTSRHFAGAGLRVPPPDSYLQRLLSYRQAVASGDPVASAQTAAFQSPA